jgi:hypothetical protein
MEWELRWPRCSQHGHGGRDTCSIVVDFKERMKHEFKCQVMIQLTHMFRKTPPLLVLHLWPVDRTNPTTLFHRRVGARRQVRTTGLRTSCPQPMPSLPQMDHPFLCHITPNSCLNGECSKHGVRRHSNRWSNRSNRRNIRCLGSMLQPEPWDQE